MTSFLLLAASVILASVGLLFATTLGVAAQKRDASNAPFLVFMALVATAIALALAVFSGAAQ